MVVSREIVALIPPSSHVTVLIEHQMVKAGSAPVHGKLVKLKSTNVFCLYPLYRRIHLPKTSREALWSRNGYQKSVSQKEVIRINDKHIDGNETNCSFNKCPLQLDFKPETR